MRKKVEIASNCINIFMFEQFFLFISYFEAYAFMVLITTATKKLPQHSIYDITPLLLPFYSNQICENDII